MSCSPLLCGGITIPKFFRLKPKVNFLGPYSNLNIMVASPFFEHYFFFWKGGGRGGLFGCWAKINVSQFKKCDNNFNKLHYSSSALFTPDLFRNSATDVSKSESWLLEVSSDFWATWDGTSLFSVNNTVSALWKIKTSYIKVIYSLIIIIYLHVMSMNSKKFDLVKTHPMIFIYLN